MIANVIAWLIAVGLVIGLTVYNVMAWAYVTGLVWSWTIGRELGIVLGFEFWVGVMFLLSIAKSGLKASIDDKEGKALAYHFAMAIVLPWLSLLIFWIVLS